MYNINKNNIYYFKIHIILIASEDHCCILQQLFRTVKACVYSLMFILDNFIYTIHICRIKDKINKAN